MLGGKGGLGRLRVGRAGRPAEDEADVDEMPMLWSDAGYRREAKRVSVRVLKPCSLQRARRERARAEETRTSGERPPDLALARLCRSTVGVAHDTDQDERVRALEAERGAAERRRRRLGDELVNQLIPAEEVALG